MIIFYSKNCEGCSGSQALAKMKSYCEKYGVGFEERRTIFWIRFEEEANEIMEIHKGLELPFFYGTESGEVLPGFSLTPLETLKTLIDKEKPNENQPRAISSTAQ